jgi:hypothetical protein
VTDPRFEQAIEWLASCGPDHPTADDTAVMLAASLFGVRESVVIEAVNKLRDAYATGDL